jgi:hypothetical protein
MVNYIFENRKIFYEKKLQNKLVNNIIYLFYEISWSYKKNEIIIKNNLKFSHMNVNINLFWYSSNNTYLKKSKLCTSTKINLY